MKLKRFFGGGDNRVADKHAHGPAHKAKVLPGRDDWRAPDFTGSNQHGVCFAGCFLRCFQAVGVFFLIAKLKRVDRRGGNFDFGEDAAVKQCGEPITRRNTHVVIAVRTDVQVVRNFAVKQHSSAIVAFGPEIVRGVATRKDRIDARPHIVRNPVHSGNTP